MHIWSLIAGLIAGGVLWGNGHKVWAVIVFLVLVSGFWLTILQGVVALVRMASPTTRRDAAQFRRAATELGVWHAFSGDELKVIFDGWRRMKSANGMDARTYLLRMFPSARTDQEA